MKLTWITGGVLVLGAAAPGLSALRSGGSPLEGALAAFKTGEYPKALELAAKVAPGSADYARALYLKGETQLLLHEPLAAETSFTGVLAERPEAVPAMVGLARALSLQGEFDEAGLHLAAALELEPDDLAAQRAQGEVAMWSGRLEEAAKILSAVYARDKQHPLSNRALVELQLRSGEIERASDIVERFVSAQAKHPLGYFLRGLVFERKNEVEQAIGAYQEALQRDERFLDAHKNLAILAHTQSDTYQIAERNDLALKHYERYFALGGKDEELEKTYLSLKGFLTQFTPSEPPRGN